MTNIQEENRKMVIMANNPDDENYEEALEMELEFGCDNLRDFKDIKIIGKPLTLDRVFIALKKYLNRDEEGHHIEPVIKIETCLYRNVNLLSYGAPDGEKYKLGVWDLSKPLDEQPEDTQLRFNNLLKKLFNNLNIKQND